MAYPSGPRVTYPSEGTESNLSERGTESDLFE